MFLNDIHFPDQDAGGFGSIGLPSGSPIVYLLNEQFQTNQPAPLPPSTPAVPGPGTVVTTDTNNKASQVGGKLLYAAGGVGYGNPGRWFDDAITRTVGRVLVVRCKMTNAQAYLAGFTTAKSSVLNANAFFVGGTALSVYENSTLYPIATLQLNTEYNLTVILRTSGAAYFIQGGAFVYNELLWLSGINGTVTLYAGVVSNGSNTSETEYISVPLTLYFPSPLASDSFNRANGALGVTNGQGNPEANGGSGLAWTNQIGTTEINTNRAQASALVGGLALATVNTGNINVLVDVTCTRSAGVIGLVLRYVDSDNYIYAGHDGTNCFLIKRVAGVETTVITAAVAFGSGLLRVVLSNTMCRLYWNNAIVGAESTIADAALQTSGVHGLYTTNTGNTSDLFAVWARGN